MQQTKSLKLDRNKAEELKIKLFGMGFSVEPPNNPYILWRLAGQNLTVMYYTSGSLVAQGTGDMNILLEPSQNSLESFKPHIGSDEVGKGDYFGPLVVCAVYLDENSEKLASEMGLKDSKKLSDLKMVEMYESLKGSIKHSFFVSTPSLYNLGVKEYKNVSFYLASLHAKVVGELLKQVGDEKVEVVVDQFSADKGRLVDAFKGLNVNLTQYHKGEQDLAVAVASVFARAIFVKEFEQMSLKYGMTFPKGATDVINFGREFVAKYGSDELNNVAKVSFRTTSQVLSLF